ncbi:MAG: alpha/beta fold hydrolase [Pseudomonadota bacterium]
MTHITFIHGIANKPPADELHERWRRALADADGIDLGTHNISSSFVYWADVMYASPSSDDSDHERVGDDIVDEPSDDDSSWHAEMPAENQDFITALAARLNYEAEAPDGDDAYVPPPSDESGFERIPLPWAIKRRLMKALLRDVHHYLFNAQSTPRPGETYRVQDEIRRRFVETLAQDADANGGNGPHIVVGHSMGTVIAYDCLKRVAACPAVDGFMTLGSPLGIDEIQDKLSPEWTRNDGFPSKVAGEWVNVADRLDPVCIDTRLANDYRRNGQSVVIDQRQRNGGKWRHDLHKYMLQDELREHMARLLGVIWP